MEKGKEVHVLPDQGKWQIRFENDERPQQVTDTQEEAVDIARKISEENHSELVIYGHDGTIREKDSHYKDPFPPEG